MALCDGNIQTVATGCSDSAVAYGLSQILPTITVLPVITQVWTSFSGNTAVFDELK